GGGAGFHHDLPAVFPLCGPHLRDREARRILEALPRHGQVDRGPQRARARHRHPSRVGLRRSRAVPRNDGLYGSGSRAGRGYRSAAFSSAVSGGWQRRVLFYAELPPEVGISILTAGRPAAKDDAMSSPAAETTVLVLGNSRDPAMRLLSRAPSTV